MNAPLILLVDDNRAYREAFRRHLELEDVAVLEAEHGDEALALLAACPEAHRPSMVITDLQMRSETEGLDLIRSLRSTDPLLPIALMSAVGTFEEGAEAQRLGAVAVFSKATIEDNLDRLLQRVRQCSQRYHEDQQQLAQIRSWRDFTLQNANAPKPFLGDLKKLLQNPTQLHPQIQQEALELLGEVEIQPAPPGLIRSDSALLERAEQLLRQDLTSFEALAAETRENLLVAEMLRLQFKEDRNSSLPDFSRIMGFSYCFAVEYEAKHRLTRRLTKFLGKDSNFEVMSALLQLPGSTPSLTVHFQQHLLLLLRGRDLDITVENFRTTLHRLNEHRTRYKADGLKALGVLLITFGRDYKLPTTRQPVSIQNPLGIKGLSGNEEVVELAAHLVLLQHSRNPYIHPEITEMEKVSKLRQSSLKCLEMVCKLQP
jgi:CheY-like chemotaxis protein